MYLGDNMDYKITIDQFEGPLDLLLHLIKQSDIDIYDIKIEIITKQYFNYINTMEEMNLNIASEYLIMAAELMEIKSQSLLPRKKVNGEEDFEEDKREQLIQRLLEYQRYKDLTPKFHELEDARKQVYTKCPANLNEYEIKKEVVNEADVSLLMKAFEEFLKRKESEKPLNTKITKKEYSVNERSHQIKSLISRKKTVAFSELFDVLSKDYIVVTFLAILNLARRSEILIKQDDNFKEILLEEKGVINE